ncbi:MAG TPA: hypothetical protein K8V84_02340 [Nocardiopsis listeri]|uniref:hypothetical protein n=1 Tax=Nocardiopsis listeri TaxID=53440 RepID=UPI001E0F4FB1|nr:hypothetical protein [Nocardiopsis listeri]HJE57344.1 hypothetical protein [Nocardiopsis listeri]
MRHHRGELGRLVDLQAEAAVAEHEDGGVGQRDEPFAYRMCVRARRVLGVPAQRLRGQGVRVTGFS